MSGLSGAGELGRLVLRRDRLQLPLWIVGLGGTIAWSATAVQAVYDTPEKVAGYAASVGASPVSYLMSGRQAGIDQIGGITANETSQIAQLGVCLMVMFLVVRHTRAEEESGRAELLRAGVLGRHAATLTALIYGFLAAFAIAAITTTAMAASGLEVTGSVAYGAGLGLLGACYAAVSLVAAQLSTSARGALGIAGAAIAIGYLVRGIGAMQDNALVWLSPFGWAQALNAFGDERWWPAAILVAATGALLGAAGTLAAHRDFAGGIVQPRPGSARAARSLGTPWGMAARLQRGSFLGWAVGLFALALIYGAVIPTVPELVESNPDIGAYLGTSAGAQQVLIDAFVSYVLVFMAVVSSAFGVSMVLRLRSEEESGRAELLLATGVGRTRWAMSTVGVTAVSSLLLTVLMGAGLALGWGLGGGAWRDALDVVAHQVSYLPAVLVVAAAAFVLVALVPRRTALGWGLVAVVFFVTLVGDALDLPDAVRALSPFWHLSGVPGEAFTPLPAIVETLVAAALIGLGVAGLRRRDVAA